MEAERSILCRRCGYDLSGTVDLIQCPECGAYRDAPGSGRVVIPVKYVAGLGALLFLPPVIFFWPQAGAIWIAGALVVILLVGFSGNLAVAIALAALVAAPWLTCLPSAFARPGTPGQTAGWLIAGSPFIAAVIGYGLYLFAAPLVGVDDSGRG